MQIIETNGRTEIWHDRARDEFYVYGVYESGDPRVVPSLGMAREIAAAYA